MDLSRVDLNLLVAFEALLLERSVTSAARRLALSQPATSDALRRLRLLFRDELFVRAAGGMQPTPKAMQLAPGIHSALAELRSTLGQQLPFDAGHEVRSFTIAATDYGTHVLAPALTSKLRSEAPGIDLHIAAYDKRTVNDLLARGVIDAAIGVFAQPPDNAVKTALFEENFVGVARHDHPAINGSLDVTGLARLPHALVTLNQDRSGVLDEALAEIGLRRRIVSTLPYMLALPAILAKSDLVSALPKRLAVTLDASLVQIFDLPLFLPAWTVEMLWNPVARTDQANAWLRGLIQTVAREL